MGPDMYRVSFCSGYALKGRRWSPALSRCARVPILTLAFSGKFCPR